jgi:hypothetical protein
MCSGGLQDDQPHRARKRRFDCWTADEETTVVYVEEGAVFSLGYTTGEEGNGKRYKMDGERRKRLDSVFDIHSIDES